MSGKPEYGKTTITGTNSTKFIHVNKRLFRHFINGCEVIFHVLTAIITTDLVVPFLSESRQSSPVRSNNYIIVGCHNLEIPAVGEELADHTLRATFAKKQGWIFFIGVKIRRINNPNQHFLVIGCGHPPLFYFS